MPLYMPYRIHQYGLPEAQRVLESIHVESGEEALLFPGQLWDTLYMGCLIAIFYSTQGYHSVNKRGVIEV